MKSEFDGLLEEIGELAKAMPADEGDKKIAAAAAESGVDATGEVDGAAGKEDAGGDGEGEGKEPMAKSFSFTLEDGTQVDAVDGTDLLKALMDRVDGIEGKTGTMVKGLIGLVKTQGELIKSMSAKLEEIGGQGKGRRAVLSIAERPTAGATEAAAGAEPQGMDAETFLGKCLIAQAQGKITGQDVAISENRIHNGLQPADHVKQAVLSLAS